MVSRQYKFMKIFEYWRECSLFESEQFYKILKSGVILPFHPMLIFHGTTWCWVGFCQWDHIKIFWRKTWEVNEKPTYLETDMELLQDFFTFKDRDILPTREAHIYVNGEFYSEGFPLEVGKLG